VANAVRRYKGVLCKKLIFLHIERIYHHFAFNIPQKKAKSVLSKKFDNSDFVVG